jgi:hypothetical protein
MSTSQSDRSQDWLGQPLYVDLDENPRLYVDLTTPYVPPPADGGDAGGNGGEDTGDGDDPSGT